MRSERAVLIVLCSLLGARSALAFDDPSQFLDSADPATGDSSNPAVTSASAQGLYFTGAPRFADQSCAACHVNGPGLARVHFGADDTSLFGSGYVPDQRYQLEVSLVGETRGLDHGGLTCTEPPARGSTAPYVQCNNNNFALEVDAGGVPLGGASRLAFCSRPFLGDGTCPPPDPFSDESFVTPDQTAVLGNRTHDRANPRTVTRNDPTSWHVYWRAPPAGTGPLHFHVAVVDGNGGAGIATDDQDPLGDDTVRAEIPVGEAGAPLAMKVAAGCSAGNATRPDGHGLLSLVVLLGWGLWQRRRWSRS